MVFPLLLSACGGGTGAGTGPSAVAPSAPSPTPSPAPSPSPSPAGPGTPSGSSLTVNPASIQGQGRPLATVTLATPAPDGGALVVLATSDPQVAKLPSTVMVAAGSRTATFVMDTATVIATTTVTITATYGGTTSSALLTVMSPTLRASFSVRGSIKGPGVCAMEETTDELDCVLDGGASQGFVDSWIWSYTVGTSTLSHVARDAGSHPQISSKCAFLNTGVGGDGPNGDRYLQMEVSLQVQDRAGVRSEATRQAVKLYPNRQCGFSY